MLPKHPPHFRLPLYWPERWCGDFACMFNYTQSINCVSLTFCPREAKGLGLLIFMHDQLVYFRQQWHLNNTKLIPIPVLYTDNNFEFIQCDFLWHLLTVYCCNSNSPHTPQSLGMINGLSDSTPHSTVDSGLHRLGENIKPEQFNTAERLLKGDSSSMNITMCVPVMATSQRCLSVPVTVCISDMRTRHSSIIPCHLLFGEKVLTFMFLKVQQGTKSIFVAFRT